MKKKKEDITISPEQRAQYTKWFEENASTLPESVRITLEQFADLFSKVEGDLREANAAFTQLKRALGIIPSSESRKSGDPIGPSKQAGDNPRGEKGKKEQPSARSKRLASWHRKMARRHDRRAKKHKQKEDKMPKVEDVAQEPEEEAKMEKMPKVEDIVLDPEEEAECDKEHEEFVARLGLGDEIDPALESTAQTLMNGSGVTVLEDNELLTVPDEQLAGVKVLDTMVETRHRIDVTLTVKRIEIELEKKIVKDASGERRMISPSTWHLGPPRYAVTWEFLVSTVMLIAQYAMPMHRLAKLLSSEMQKFTAGYLGRLFQYAAHRFVPIYLKLVDELADSPVWIGDDTSVRVVEVANANKSPPEELKPWESYKTMAKATETYRQQDDRAREEWKKHPLGVMLSSELGFEFPRRGPQKGTKTTLHTTVVSGRSIADDPHSLIVLYRSHLGSLGNLLEILLEKRKANLKQVVIQSDLSSANLVADSKLCEKFEITYAGCASHARRPFALYEEEDPDNCAAILHFFKGLFIYEQCLDTNGRNRERVLAVRGVDSRKLWETIKEWATDMLTRWPTKTKLGDAANYILKNYEKLTMYLEDPRLSLTNNFSENMLRLEKLIESSSLFRKSLEGRFALDIMRTMLQTAVAAGVPVKEYMLYVLRTKPEEVAENPELFTPLAYRKMKSSLPQPTPAT